MSDPKSSYGEPVEDPTAVDDVVGSVNEGLADAEAAGRDAVADSEQPSTEAPAEEPAVESAPAAEAEPAEAPAYVEPEPAEPAYVEPEPAEAAYVEPEPTAEEIAAAGAAAAANVEPAYVEPAYVEPEADHNGAAAAAAAAAAYAVAPSEPVAQAPYAVAPQPIFVQAPEPPRPRGNRAAAGAIGLLATVSFAVLYVAAWLGIGFVTGDITTDDVVTPLTTAVQSWVFWLPIVLFFIGFWLLGAIINRGRWAHWVIFGIFVGVISWAGYVLGILFQEPFWMLTPTEGVDLVTENLFAPLAVAAFIIGRELTIWFGAWAAARGKRVTELNIEAMREYERTLEAGPQIYRQ